MAQPVGPIGRISWRFRSGRRPVHAVAAPAEFWGVQAAAPGFTDVLDEKLAAYVGLTGEAPAARPSSGFGRPGGWQPWLGFGPDGSQAGAQFARAYGKPTSMPVADPAPVRPPVDGDLRQPSRPPVRPLHITTPRQRAALARLRELGARDLGPTAADVDLKRAFRQLARLYHPDSRPELSGDERRRLARLFADACDAYHCLLSSAT